jgi:hypothetical protein
MSDNALPYPERDLRNNGVAQASKPIHSVLYIVGNSWNSFAFPRFSQRFIAFSLPISRRHSLLHVACFLEWHGMNSLPQTLHGFACFAFRVPSR